MKAINVRQDGLLWHFYCKGTRADQCLSPDWCTFVKKVIKGMTNTLLELSFGKTLLFTVICIGMSASMLYPFGASLLTFSIEPLLLARGFWGTVGAMGTSAVGWFVILIIVAPGFFGPLLFFYTVGVQCAKYIPKSLKTFLERREVFLLWVLNFCVVAAWVALIGVFVYFMDEISFGLILTLASCMTLFLGITGVYFLLSAIKTNSARMDEVGYVCDAIYRKICPQVRVTDEQNEGPTRASTAGHFNLA